METKFTRGEWTVKESKRLDSIIPDNERYYANVVTNNGSYFQKVNASDDYLVCQQFNVSSKNVEGCREILANAKLIAQSPNMFKYILRKANEGCEDAKRIVAAIM
jgi:hypothetical protein